ncbi:NAD(P)H-hydrate dehydratase [Chitinibacter bivalviorum]|uniref:ADP-dependent (S)-NAD(P)H-hydrate dehydratase n=1 Tax=Chitinibacter bivalviorum TaxID=2739434 RepID=A0A7H9BKZ3_9NEIS|nr:NAD(P)H-hydrate dehydratase [Chitinibacter bivalviorum]QLG89062.1 NAD(P)H-hydrate dehydratase [Chitinibacter bivalviorum]
MLEINALPPRAKLLLRGDDTHKGLYGGVAVIGGAHGMTGAALLAGRAALNLGAGKIWVGMLDENVAVDFHQPELMICRAEALFQTHLPTHFLVGMGLGMSPEANHVLALAMDTSVPLLLDADALNLIALHPHLQLQLAERSAPSLLTPHPSEAARLLSTTTEHVQQDRVSAVRTLSERFQCHVVLKGHGTLVQAFEGELSINHSGNAALSSAGQGDTLAGIIMALCAQGLDLALAARCGVFLHGQAADDWRTRYHAGIGLTASETILLARAALNRLLK